MKEHIKEEIKMYAEDIRTSVEDSLEGEERKEIRSILGMLTYQQLNVY